MLSTFKSLLMLLHLSIGVALAQPPLIQILANTKAPYNVSTPTSVLALQALSPSSLQAMQRKIVSLNNERSQLVSALASFSSLGLGSPLGGNDANFLLVPILDRQNGNPDNARAFKVLHFLPVCNHSAEISNVLDIQRASGKARYCNQIQRRPVGM